jgi:AcrR family transcriptional regulator
MPADDAKTTSTPAPRRERDSAQTREALLTAALELFERNGFDATGVNEIVQTAGVTKGAFYHHFTSKDDLLQLFHDRFLDALLAQTEEALQQSTSPSEQLRRLIHANVGNSEQYKAEITVFFNEYRRLSETTFAAIKAKRDRYEQAVADVIARGIEQGDFRPLVNTQLMAFGVIGMCTWTYRWFDPEGPVSLDAIAEMYAGAMLEGLRPRS